MIYFAIGGAFVVAVIFALLLHVAHGVTERYETMGDRDDTEEVAG